VCWWIVVQHQTQEGEEDEDCGPIEQPSPLVVELVKVSDSGRGYFVTGKGSTHAILAQLYCAPPCDRANDNIKLDPRIRKNDSNVSPLVRQELGDGKCGKLRVSGAKTDDGHGGNHLCGVLRATTDNKIDEQENITRYDKPASTK
jgi:hypothetical protein